jgi:hypothetical protein
MSDDPNFTATDSLKSAYQHGLLSARAYRALRRNRIRSVEQLEQLTQTDLLGLRSVGAKTLSEFQTFVRTHQKVSIRQWTKTSRRGSQPSGSTREIRASPNVRRGPQVWPDVPPDSESERSERPTAEMDLKDAFFRGRLSTRAYNCLVAGGITTTSALLAVDQDQLLTLRGVGTATVLEIAAYVASESARHNQTSGLTNGPPVFHSALDPTLRTSRTYTGQETIAEALANRDVSASIYRNLLSRGVRTIDEVTRLNDLELRSVAGSSARSLRQIGDLLLRVDRQLNASRDHSESGKPALSRLARIARSLMSPDEWLVLRHRQTETLEGIGRRLRITRERVRQIEAKAERKLRLILLGDAALVAEWRIRLERPAVAELSLVEQHIDAATESADQREVAKFILLVIGAQHPRRFTGQLEVLLPCENAQMDAAIAALALDKAVPVEELLADAGSPVRRNSVIDGWVHARGQDRDAVWLVLQRRGSPQPIMELARELRIPRHNLEEALRRDDRFCQTRPSRRWAISEWKVLENSHAGSYETTIDAVREVILDLGPQRLSQLTRNVIARYPVSPAAIAQCLAHEDIGRWPDGRVDLIANGAPAVKESEPAVPAGVFPEDRGRTLAILMPVTRDMLRGSGLGVPRYVSWALGLRRAPQERLFRTHEGEQISIRKRIQGTNISTLRRFAESLGAEVGCDLVVRLNTTNNAANVSLGCQGNCLHRRDISLEDTLR